MQRKARTKQSIHRFPQTMIEFVRRMRIAETLFSSGTAGRSQRVAGKPHIVADAGVFPDRVSTSVIVDRFPVLIETHGEGMKFHCREASARLQDGMNSLCPYREIGKPA